MNPRIELKLKLVELLAKGAFGLNENCMPLVRDAYAFVTEDVDLDKDDITEHSGISEETAKELSERLAAMTNSVMVKNPCDMPDYMETTIKDGVYLGYEDGHVEMFNGNNNNPDDVEFVAFKFGAVSLKIWGKDIKDIEMTTDNDGAALPYVTKYSDAAHDFSGAERTKDLLARDLDCNCEGFKRGWYIPAIGELCVMYLMKDAINAALEYTDREPLGDIWYWSSTETSAANAWLLYFSNGNFGSSYKTGEYSVRPVSAFRP